MPRCPSCARETYPEDAFCSQCGTRLQARTADTGVHRRTLVKQTTPTADRLACGSCNTPLLAGDTFCATCGARYGPITPQPGQREIREEILLKLEAATRGKFEFIREIGRGGMGAVYLARELDLERDVAIKVLSASWLGDGSMIERFRREAKTVASLRHPSIVHVLGVGSAGDIHYFVMDYIDGVSLGKILLTHGPLSIRAALAILGQVGSALKYAHRPGRSVIHRDIKPGNIMVDGDGGSYITDFGISKATESHSGLTMTGLIMGTPEYMSPEQCRGDTTGPAADQYAIGAVAFAMLTGSPPFTGPHYSVLVGHTSDAPPSVLELRPDCPGSVAAAINRMLAKAPGDRWPDMAHAMAALGARPTTPDDPVRDELAGLVMAARGARRHDTGPTPQALGRRSAASATPTWLRILSAPASLESGDAIDLRALKGFADGREIENGDVEWSSTDPAIARVDADSGRLVAIGTGSAVITASIAGIRESVSIDVKPARVARLTVDPPALQLEVGESRVFGAVPQGRVGQTLNRPVLWSSSEPGIASVDDAGEVQAHRDGHASILAHCESAGASASITVVPADIATIEFTGAPESMHIGERRPLAFMVRDARGVRLDRRVMLSTSDDAIAGIGTDGVLVAIAEGRASITATCQNTSVSFELSVSPQLPAAIRTTSPPSELLEGDTFHLIATPLDRDGQPLGGEVDWSVADERVIESLGGGRFRAIADGRTTVHARSGETESKIALSVDPLRVASLALSVVPRTIQVDGIAELAVELCDQRGRPIDRPVTFASSDPWIARVNPRGILEGAGPGSVMITAECDGLTDSVPVEVTAAPWATVVFRPERPRDAAGGEADQAAGAAMETPASDPAIVGPPVAGRAAEHDSVAGPEDDVESGGDVAQPRPNPEGLTGPRTRELAGDGVSAGQAGGGAFSGNGRRRLIWITPGLAMGLAVLTWVALSGGDKPQPPPPPPIEPVAASVSIVDAATSRAVPVALEMLVGDTIRLDAVVTADNGTVMPNAGITWLSGDPALASVDAAGLLRARAAGVVRVSAETAAVSHGIDLTIGAPPTIARASGQADAGNRGGPAPGPRGDEREPQGQQRDTPPVDTAIPPPSPPDSVGLEVLVIPPADISINGEVHARGQRRFEIKLAPGIYQLRMVNPARLPKDTTIQLLPGRPLQLRFTLATRGS